MTLLIDILFTNWVFEIPVDEVFLHVFILNLKCSNEDGSCTPIFKTDLRGFGQMYQTRNCEIRSSIHRQSLTADSLTKFFRDFFSVC